MIIINGTIIKMVLHIFVLSVILNSFLSFFQLKLKFSISCLNETEWVSESHSVVSDYLWPMDCNLAGSSVLGILQARILEWVAISFSCHFLLQMKQKWYEKKKKQLVRGKTQTLINESKWGLKTRNDCARLTTEWA